MDSRTFSYSCKSSCGSNSISHVSKRTTDSDIPPLSSILESPEIYLRSDATIVVGGNHEIPVHRHVLCIRSPFFNNLFYGAFAKDRDGKFEMKELGKDFDVGFDSLLPVLDYLYCGKLNPLSKDVFRCADDDCSHIGCRPDVNFKVEVLYASFIFQISELLSHYQTLLIDTLDDVVADDILLILKVANICRIVCDTLLTKCIEILAKSDMDVITLERALQYDISTRIMDFRVKLGFPESGSCGFLDRHVKRIHRALDSDDVEWVRMLLKEEHTSLDHAYALHYAISYCDVKTVMELLDLGLADVNCRNPRGYSVLHVAAMRREPGIIDYLISMGARPFDLTPDGRKALQISKRFTRFAGYNRLYEEGISSSKDQLCIQILELAERIYSSLEVSPVRNSLHMTTQREPLHTESPYLLERRDPLFQEFSPIRSIPPFLLLDPKSRDREEGLVQPMKAKDAINIGQVDGSLRFPPLPAGSDTLGLEQGTIREETSSKWN